MKIIKLKSSKIIVCAVSLAFFLTGNVFAGINDTDSNGRTALINNVIAGNISAVKDLVSRGASLNWRDNKGRTALMYAIICKQPAISKFLLKQRDININYQDNDRDNALTIALFESDWEISKILLNKRLTSGWRSKNGHTIISLKILQKKYDDAKKIIELFASAPSGSNIKNEFNDQDNDGDTPLHAAVLMDRPDLVKALLKAGAWGYANNNQLTPLHYAIIKNSPEIASLLVEYGMDAEKRPKHDYYSPIEFAIVKGNLAVVQAMIKGYDKNAAKSNSKRYELTKEAFVIFAIMQKQPAIADALLSAGAKIPSDSDIAMNVGANWQTTQPEAYKVISKARLGGSEFKVPDDVSAQYKMCETAITLDKQDILDKVLNDDKVSLSNDSLIGLFRLAVAGDKEKIAAYLYEFVAAAPAVNEMYKVAMENGSEKCFNFLLQKKVKTGLEKEQGKFLRENTMSVYHLATIRGGSVAILKYLQSHGAKINMIYSAANLNGMSVTNPSSLMVAAERGRLEMVKYLIENGADPRYHTFEYQDALQYAVLSNSPEICSYLLSKGANPNLVNDFNENSVVLAKKCNNKKIEDILVKAGGISHKMRLKAIYQKQELNRRNKRK